MPPNLLKGGTFTDGQGNFTLSKSENADLVVTWGPEARFDITNGGSADWEIQMIHGIKLEANQQYILCYDAKADAPNRSIVVQLDANMDGSDNDSTAWRTLSQPDGKPPAPISLSTTFEAYEYPFTAIDSDSTARVNFSLGASNVNVQVDNVGLYEGGQCGDPSANNSVFTVGDLVEAEFLNADVSKGYTNPDGNVVGDFAAGSVLCYDDIDLTGVNSIEFSYARNAAQLNQNKFAIPTDGRFAILAGGPDPLTAINLGEKFTTHTGEGTFAPLKVGLEPHNIEVTQLCFFGTESGGIGNFDNFMLSADMADNDGLTQFDLSVVPTGPSVDPIAVGTVDIGNGQTQKRVLFGGEDKSLAGLSLFWSAPPSGTDAFYNKDAIKWLVDNWNIRFIRAAMAVDDKKPGGASLEVLGGYLTNPFPNKHALEEVVHAAIENGIYVIIDWHAHKAEDSKAEAIAFFKEMAQKYGQYDNIIYEIYNEPVFTDWSVIKSYAEDVIAEIRAIDPDNLIIVGTRTYSQEVDVASQSPINDPNIAYTLHFYASTHGQNELSKAQTALDNGIALFVTEWGITEASGDGSIASGETLNRWLRFMKNNKINHANWAISSHAQNSALVKKPSPDVGPKTRGGWVDQDLTAGGQAVKDIIIDWENYIIP